MRSFLFLIRGGLVVAGIATAGAAVTATDSGLAAEVVRLRAQVGRLREALPAGRRCRASPFAVSCVRAATDGRLCLGVDRVLRASCHELLDETFLADVVRAIGLAPNWRGARIYGFEAAAAFPPRGAAPGAGLFQLPQQLAAALVHLSTMRIGSYLELGVYTGWTACLVVAYLSRWAPSSRFDSFAVDVTFRRVEPATRALMRSLNVTLALRPKLAKLLAPARRPIALGRHGLAGLRGRVGLCFIDANHSYAAVRADYEQLAPHCRAVMFHDVVDADLWNTADRGVPAFWAHLKANLAPARVREFTQGAVYPPSLGLGVVAPSAAGGAEPESPLSRPWFVGGAGEAPAGPDPTKPRGEGCVGCSFSTQACHDERGHPNPRYCELAGGTTSASELANWCAGKDFTGGQRRRRFKGERAPRNLCRRTCGFCSASGPTPS